MDELDETFSSWLYSTYWRAQEPAGGPVHLIRHYVHEFLEGVYTFATLADEHISMRVLVGQITVTRCDYCEFCLAKAQIIFSGEGRTKWRPNPSLL